MCRGAMERAWHHVAVANFLSRPPSSDMRLMLLSVKNRHRIPPRNANTLILRPHPPRRTNYLFFARASRKNIEKGVAGQAPAGVVGRTFQWLAGTSAAAPRWAVYCFAILYFVSERVGA